METDTYDENENYEIDEFETEESEEEEAQENDSDTENDLDEKEESNDSEEENTDEDDKSTQNAELPTEEDIDWEYQVPVTVDGKTEYVSLEEIRKGYSTDKHLSQKGRELGELKKQIETERNEKLQELITLGSVVNEELTAVETKLSGEYHKIKGDIDSLLEKLGAGIQALRIKIYGGHQEIAQEKIKRVLTPEMRLGKKE